MPKVWKLKPKIPENIASKLSNNPPLLTQLLYNRGMTAEQEIKEFLQPKYEGLNSPFLFKDMEKAVERIWRAIENKEKICVYGDYDADAVTANAVLQQTFRYLGVEAESYIPDRFTEGYGVNMEALLKIKDKGSKIIITVDCGTNSIDAAEFCNANGIDLIITDHHEIIGEKPAAYALINPKNSDDNYPYSEITGVGVAFKLASAILASEKLKVKSEKFVAGWEKWLLDLVAIGTVADCHSLKGENRILVKFGLKVLQKTKWPGLKALMLGAGLDLAKPMDTYTLGFIIAPRLNAAGRLEHADAALALLLADNMPSATQKAAVLEEVNKRRQDITARILSEAREQAIVIKERKVLVMANADWHKGVVGLVAGKLAEEFYKPVIILEKTTEFCTGSARTAGEFNLIEALKSASEHLVRFGGHKQAAGLTLQTASFEPFYQKILDYAENNISETSAGPVLELEAELQEPDLQLSTFNFVTSLEPFGEGNPKPKFLINAIKILSTRNVGKTKQHMQMQLQKGQKTISAIAFNSGFLEKNFKTGDTVDVACELLEDGWNGGRELKLRIVDMRAAGA